MPELVADGDKGLDGIMGERARLRSLDGVAGCIRICTFEGWLA